MQRNGTMIFQKRGDGLQFLRGRKNEKGEKWAKSFKVGDTVYTRGDAHKERDILALTNVGLRIEIEPVQPKRIVQFEGMATAKLEALPDPVEPGSEDKPKRGRPAKNESKA